MQNQAHKKSEIKVAIHRVSRLNRYGRAVGGAFWDSLVVSGENPLGPRGGHDGTWVSGKGIKRFKDYDKAVEFANAYAKENGFMLLG